MRIRATIGWSLEMLAGDELAPDDPDTVRADRVPGAQLGHLQPQRLAGQHGRAHVARIPRPDDPVRPLPRPQVRPDLPGRLLPPPRLLRALSHPDRPRARRAGPDQGRPAARIRRLPGSADLPLRPRRGIAARHARGPSGRATPAVLGGEVRIEPIPLPLTAACPDKRPFVIDEARAEADRAVVRTQAAVDEARRRFDRAEQRPSHAARELDARAAASFAAATGKPDRLEPPGPRRSRPSNGWPACRPAESDAREDRDVAEAALDLAESRSDRRFWRSWPPSGSRTRGRRRTARHLGPRRPGRGLDRSAVARAGRREPRRAPGPARRRPCPADPRRPPGRGDGPRRRPIQGRPCEGRRGAGRGAGPAGRRGEGTGPGRGHSPRGRRRPTTRRARSNSPGPRRPTATRRATPPTRRSARAGGSPWRDGSSIAATRSRPAWRSTTSGPAISASRWSASMSDFGLRSARPELVDLLDWLAVELMESGWSLKHLHRLIVTSEAYRMRSSRVGSG